MKQLLYLVAAFLVGCIATAIFLTERKPIEPTVTTITLYDTIPYYVAVARDSVVVRYETHRLPVAPTSNVGIEDNLIAKNDSAENDSVDAIIPITQKEYQDSTYHAWISGYAVNLDSIYTYTRHEYTTVQFPPSKPKRWHLGITAGFAITPKGVQPYIGGGITYSFKSY